MYVILYIPRHVTLTPETKDLMHFQAYETMGHHPLQSPRLRLEQCGVQAGGMWEPACSYNIIEPHPL